MENLLSHSERGIAATLFDAINAVRLKSVHSPEEKRAKAEAEDFLLRGITGVVESYLRRTRLHLAVVGEEERKEFVLSLARNLQWADIYYRLRDLSHAGRKAWEAARFCDYQVLALAATNAAANSDCSLRKGEAQIKVIEQFLRGLLECGLLVEESVWNLAMEHASSVVKQREKHRARLRATRYK